MAGYELNIEMAFEISNFSRTVSLTLVRAYTGRVTRYHAII